jgi:TPR repeat protein
MWIVAVTAHAAETPEQLFLKAQTAYGAGDQQLAVELLRKSATAGFAEAQFNLGLFYHNGQVVAKDHAEAHALYLEAAEQGHAKAQVNVAIFYYYGVAVPEDRIAAYMWFSLAHAAGVEQVKENLDLAENDLTPEQLARAREMVRAKQIEIRERTAATGD